MVEALLWGVVTALLATIVIGIRRFPWRWCAVFGLGWGVLTWAVRVSSFGPDPAMSRFLDAGGLVMIGALGGILIQLGFDRGERSQQRRTAAILDTPPA